MSFRTTLPLAALAFALSFAPASAQNPPLDTVRVASGLTLPLFVGSPRGDANRLFIVEQRSSATGRIKVLDLPSGIVSPTVYLSVSPVATGNEQGLLGLAFHPDFANNGFFYVNYTASPGGATVVARYTANLPYMTSATADASSALQILTIAQPFSNHNGGWIGFGPDGYLYVAMGDGGSANDPNGNAQNVNALLGKMLRIDVDGDDFPLDPAKNYRIPPTNPFAGGTPGADEIWHVGLRNPWRNGFDRLTGDLYIGDVGQNAQEEISFQAAGLGGLNYGWRCMEGTNCTGLSGCTCNSPSLTLPIRTYSHGSGCSVSGGYVYRGSAICGLDGTYFFADYCSSQIWSFRYAGGVLSNFTTRTAELAPGGGLSINSITSFGEDDAGEMYICDQGGEIYKIVPGAITDCNGNSVHDGCDIDQGTSQDTNQNGVPDECENIITLCHPGFDSVINCPCANPPFGSDRGCDNFGTNTGGASLNGTGLPSLANDTLVLSATDENSTSFTIFWTGQTLISPPGVHHGAGVRCVSALNRLYSGSAVGGAIARPGMGDPSVSARSAAVGAPIVAGQTRYYFTVYRDPSAAGPCGNSASTVNLSDTVGVQWAP